MMENFYIFTEAYNCGLILKKCLETFFKHHKNIKVNVFGTQKDFGALGHFDDVIYHDMSNDSELMSCYSSGHLGTAHIFTKVIKELSHGKKYIIHFDSDTIFRSESISIITNKLNDDYDLVGPRRCYKNNLNGREDLKNSNIPDVVQTYFYGFNKEKITERDFNTLRSMSVGAYMPFNHGMLDFFDPVSFDIIYNGGKIHYIDFNLVGAQDENGNRINKYGNICVDTDFGDCVVHFAGIGSGMKFYNYGSGGVPRSYSDWSIKRYAMYMKLFYDIELPNVDIDENKYNLLKEIEWNN